MTARRYGYGRVSTKDQNLSAQHDALVAAGIPEESIFVEKVSTRLTQRPQLEELRKRLREGDTLTVTKVDRLARSVLDLLKTTGELQEAGIEVEFLSGRFDQKDPMSKAFFQIAGVFAELERDLIRQRTMEGLAAARARGRKGGRKPKLTPAQAAQVKRLYDAREMTVAEIGEQYNITRESVYRYLNPAKGAKGA